MGISKGIVEKGTVMDYAMYERCVGKYGGALQVKKMVCLQLQRTWMKSSFDKPQQGGVRQQQE